MTTSMKNVWERTPTIKPILPYAPPAPSKLPMWRCTVLDADAWRGVDPLQPATFPCWVAGTEPRVVRVGDVAAARFEPTESAVSETLPYQLSLDSYELLVEQFGADDSGETSGLYDREGAAAMDHVMPTAEMRGIAMHDYRKSIEVRVRMAEAVGRSFGMTPEAIASMTGRAYIPRRSMLPTCGRAHELDEQRRQAEATAERAKATTVAIQVEAARERTVAEAHLIVFEVQRARVGVAHGLEVWFGAMKFLLWETEHTVCFGFRAVPAIHAPPRWEANGVRLLASDEVVRASSVTAALDPDRGALDFIHGLRVAAGLNFGAMKDLVPLAPAMAHTLAADNARAILSPSPAVAWRADWICELFVRCADFRMRPDVALTVLLPALDAAFLKAPQNEPMRIPTHGSLHYNQDGEVIAPTHKLVAPFKPDDVPSRSGMVGVLGARLVRATQVGDFVSVNEPLEPPQPSSTPIKRRSTTGK